MVDLLEDEDKDTEVRESFCLLVHVVCEAKLTECLSRRSTSSIVVLRPFRLYI